MFVLRGVIRGSPALLASGNLATVSRQRAQNVVDQVELLTQEGRRLAHTAAGDLVDVVVATGADLAALGMEGLAEGVYVVGTGGTGAAETFMTLSAVYLVTILAGAMAYRLPADDWKPAGWNPPTVNDSDDGGVDGKGRNPGGNGDTPEGEGQALPMITNKNVHIDQALKTPQFYALWINLCANVTAGIGVIGVAKTMVTDIFSPSMPTIGADLAGDGSWKYLCLIAPGQ